MSKLKLTPLLAAAFLLAATATAPAASALCVGSTTCVTGTVKVAGQATGEVTGTAIAVVGIVVALAEDLSMDADRDNFPDAAEMAICGNSLLRDLANEDLIPGHCLSPSDYVPPPVIEDVISVVMLVLGIATEEAGKLVKDGEELAEEVQRIFWLAVGEALRIGGEAYKAVDSDSDRVADTLEPLICRFVQNDNFEETGTCDAEDEDYDPHFT